MLNHFHFVDASALLVRIKTTGSPICYCSLLRFAVTPLEMRLREKVGLMFFLKLVEFRPSAPRGLP